MEEHGLTGIGADGVIYVNSSIKSATVEDALDTIIGKLYYVSPSITSFTMSPSTTTYEIGSSVGSLKFSWVLNKVVTSISLTGCSVSVGDTTATYSTTFSTAKTFTLTVSDGTNSTSSSKTINFYNKKFWGAATEPTTYDSADRKSVV